MPVVLAQPERPPAAMQSPHQSEGSQSCHCFGISRWSGDLTFERPQSQVLVDDLPCIGDVFTQLRYFSTVASAPLANKELPGSLSDCTRRPSLRND